MSCLLNCKRLQQARGCNKPIKVGKLTIEFSTSITRINNIGDRGSPCLRPRWWKIMSPGFPFTKICVEEVDKIKQMRSHHRWPNPTLRIISRRNDQQTESNALEMSNLRRIWASFFLCKDFTICCTNIKLSCILLPRTKALFFSGIRRRAAYHCIKIGEKKGGINAEVQNRFNTTPYSHQHTQKEH